jgi:hypothetical protein
MVFLLLLLLFLLVAGEFWMLGYWIIGGLLYRGDQIKEDEEGGTCSMHGRIMKCIQSFG